MSVRRDGALIRLEGACPGTSTCKHGRNRASRCVDCQAEKVREPCEPQATAPLAKKTKRFYGSSHCPGNMWPMGPLSTEPLA